MPGHRDLTGGVFARLTVISPSSPQVSGGKSYTRWVCRCECGARIIVKTVSLTRGQKKSCGCLRSERLSENIRKFRNGMRFTVPVSSIGGPDPMADFDEC